MVDFFRNLMYTNNNDDTILEEKMGFAEYEALLKKHPNNIKSVKIIPPNINENGLGKVLVKYKTPISKKPTKKTKRVIHLYR